MSNRKYEVWEIDEIRRIIFKTEPKRLSGDNQNYIFIRSNNGRKREIDTLALKLNSK